MTPFGYSEAICPDSVPSAEFMARAASIQLGVGVGVEEQAYQLASHFFPDHLRFIDRPAWGVIFQRAMEPNSMGVTGVVVGGPIFADCIKLARHLEAAE